MEGVYWWDYTYAPGTPSVVFSNLLPLCIQPKSSKEQSPTLARLPPSSTNGDPAAVHVVRMYILGSVAPGDVARLPPTTAVVTGSAFSYKSRPLHSGTYPTIATQ
jgi:hypothetical protein